MNIIVTIKKFTGIHKDRARLVVLASGKRPSFYVSMSVDALRSLARNATARLSEAGRQAQLCADTKCIERTNEATLQAAFDQAIAGYK